MYMAENTVIKMSVQFADSDDYCGDWKNIIT